jgi:hypothetical protein
MGWISLLMIGGAIAIAVSWLVRGRPRLLVTDRGILDRSLGVGWICWDEIEGAYQARTGGEPRPPSVSLRLRPGARAARRLRRARPQAPDALMVRVDLTGSEVSTVELLQAVVARGGVAGDEPPA